MSYPITITNYDGSTGTITYDSSAASGWYVLAIKRYNDIVYAGGVELFSGTGNTFTQDDLKANRIPYNDTNYSILFIQDDWSADASAGYAMTPETGASTYITPTTIDANGLITFTTNEIFNRVGDFDDRHYLIVFLWSPSGYVADYQPVTPTVVSDNGDGTYTCTYLFNSAAETGHYVPGGFVTFRQGHSSPNDISSPWLYVTGYTPNLPVITITGIDDTNLYYTSNQNASEILVFVYDTNENMVGVGHMNLTSAANSVAINWFWTEPTAFDSGNTVYLTISNGQTFVSNVFTLGGDVAPPCFPAGQKLLTTEGFKNVEDVKTGDRAITSDKRIVKVKAYTYDVMGTEQTAPYKISAHAFGTNNPPNDICLSPWHALQVGNNAWQKPRIARMFNNRVQQYDVDKPVSYYHFETPDYLRDNLIVNGAVVESYEGHQLKTVKQNTYTFNDTTRTFSRITKADIKRNTLSK